MVRVPSFTDVEIVCLRRVYTRDAVAELDPLWPIVTGPKYAPFEAPALFTNCSDVPPIDAVAGDFNVML